MKWAKCKGSLYHCRLQIEIPAIASQDFKEANKRLIHAKIQCGTESCEKISGSVQPHLAHQHIPDN